jgi:hypothetical protein
MQPEAFFAQAIRSARSQSELASVLSRLLVSGLAGWDDGSLYHIRARVASIHGLALHVFPLDHDPPHFHVVGADVDAKFSLDSCQPMSGRLDGKSVKLIQWFFANGGRDQLIAMWNRTRPADVTDLRRNTWRENRRAQRMFP